MKYRKLIEILGALIIGFATYGVWVGLELIMYGEVQSRGVDNIIGFILIWSLYGNFMHWIDRRR